MSEGRKENKTCPKCGKEFVLKTLITDDSVKIGCPIHDEFDEEYLSDELEPVGTGLYQYGDSEPSEDEEEAFFNWFRDTFAVKK